MNVPREAFDAVPASGEDIPHVKLQPPEIISNHGMDDVQ